MMKSMAILVLLALSACTVPVPAKITVAGETCRSSSTHRLSAKYWSSYDPNRKNCLDESWTIIDSEGNCWAFDENCHSVEGPLPGDDPMFQPTDEMLENAYCSPYACDVRGNPITE